MSKRRDGDVRERQNSAEIKKALDPESADRRLHSLSARYHVVSNSDFIKEFLFDVHTFLSAFPLNLQVRKETITSL